MPRHRRVGGALGQLEDLAARGALFRPNDREESRALAVPREVREARGEQRGEFVAVELANVECIRHAALVGVLDLVRARQDDEAARPQHAADFVEKRFLRRDVLDRLERHDRIEAGIGKRQPRAVGLAEFEIGDRGIMRARMCEGGRRDVGAGDVSRGAREERAAIALAAGDVEHLEAADEIRGEMVAMPMLVPDLAFGAGNETLAGELELVGHAGARQWRGGEQGAPLAQQDGHRTRRRESASERRDIAAWPCRCPGGRIKP